MDSIVPKRYVGLVGFGLLYMWGMALIPWLGLWQSDHTGVKMIAFLGAALVSGSGIAIALYTNNLELTVRRLNDRNDRNAAEARKWKEQAQAAIALLEEERNL